MLSQMGYIDAFATRAGFISILFLELLAIAHPLSRNGYIICLLGIIFFYWLYIYKHINYCSVYNFL